VTRSCDFCGISYQARRRSSRFCSPRCRSRNNGRPKLCNALHSSTTETDTPSPLAVSTLVELEAAGRVYSVPGQLALALVTVMESPMQTGSSVAARSKEFADRDG
jgi:hypothetical protein